MLVLAAFAVFLCLLLLVPFWLEAKRRCVLPKANGTYEMDRAIIEQKLFEGMSTQQLSQAWGPPEEIAMHRHGGKRKEVWHYGPDGRGRFRDHVHVEEGVVVAWKRRRTHGGH